MKQNDRKNEKTEEEKKLCKILFTLVSLIFSTS